MRGNVDRYFDGQASLRFSVSLFLYDNSAVHRTLNIKFRVISTLNDDLRRDKRFNLFGEPRFERDMLMIQYLYSRSVGAFLDLGDNSPPNSCERQ